MKISEIKKSYFIMSGIVLIVIAFFIYAWFDTQRLAKAFSPDSRTENKTNMTKNEIEPTNVKTDQAEPLKSDDPKVTESKLEQSKDETEKASEEDRKEDKLETKTVKNPKEVKTDDWMFEKGENIEEEKTRKTKDNGSNATSE